MSKQRLKNGPVHISVVISEALNSPNKVNSFGEERPIVPISSVFKKVYVNTEPTTRFRIHRDIASSIVQIVGTVCLIQQHCL